MKFKLIYILVFALAVSCNQNNLDVVTDFKSSRISQYFYSSESDSNPINENWVKEDSLFLSELRGVLKNDKTNIIGILKINEKDKRTKLGFGYEHIQSSMGKGYAGIYYTLILKEGQIISYEFIPDFPSNKDLKERYLKLFSGIFKIDNNTIHNRYYNIEKVENTLQNINSNILLNENLKFLMTPFPGIRYGYYGGYGGSIFVNRDIFLNEIKNMNPDICKTLMYSKNPSTRLMAIEYYMKNKSDFESPDLLNNWIDKVYLELPTIETLEGCFVTKRDSKELVSEYVNRKK